MTIKIKTGTRTQVNAAASANTLVPTELIFVTNESKVEVATSGNTTAAVGGTSTSNVGDVIYSPTAPDSRWLACDGRRVQQNVYSDLFSLVSIQDSPVGYPMTGAFSRGAVSVSTFQGRLASWTPDSRYVIQPYDNSAGGDAAVFDAKYPITYAPITIPNFPANVQGASVRSDGRYVSLSCRSSPYVATYDFTDSTSFVKLSDPSTLPTGPANSVAWSPSNRYLALAHATSPFVTIYDWQSGSPVKITNPATLPTGNGSYVAWSPNNRYLAVAHFISPFVTIYDWATGSPVKIANPTTLPTANADSLSWSPNGQYLVVGQSTVAPYIRIYNWANGSPVSVTPAVSPNNSVRTTSWSPDGKYLFVGTVDANGPFIYDWTSGVPVRVTSTGFPTGLQSYAVSPDGKVVLTQNNSTIRFYGVVTTPAVPDFYLPKIDGAYVKVLPDSASLIPFSSRLSSEELRTLTTETVSSTTVTVSNNVTIHHTLEKTGGAGTTCTIATVIDGVSSNVVAASGTVSSATRTLTAGQTLRYDMLNSSPQYRGKLTIRLNNSSGQIVDVITFSLGVNNT